MDKEIRAMSLFAGGGIGETYLEDIGVKTLIANELIEKRANIHKYRFPTCEMVIGDIKEHKQELEDRAKELDIIDAVQFDYVLIENVPKFLSMQYYDPIVKKKVLLPELLNNRYSGIYNIKAGVYNAADYGVPQLRKRTIIRMYKKGLNWDDPEIVQHRVTLQEAIGHLPSLESGEKSGIKWHDGPKHKPEHILWMRHTPTGQTAKKNPVYYPQKPNGERIKSYADTFMRLKWDAVCPTRTMNSKGLSSSHNCHPGRPYVDTETGETLYTDARALSLLELFIVTSLPEDMDFPEWATDKLIRDVVGEGVPPKMMEAFIKKIK